MDWRKYKCPKCGRKGLHYANHPHAYGYKDYNRLHCRWCHGYFDADKLEKYIKGMEEK